MKYFNNALPGALIPAGITVKMQITTDEAREYLAKIDEPKLGHKDVAAIVGSELGREIKFERVTLPPFKAGDEVLVAQYVGPRLPEGATTLPEGASIAYELYSFMG